MDMRTKRNGALGAPETRTTQKTLLAACAAAISAMGLFVGPAPAHAEDPCSQYEFNGPFVFQTDVQKRVETNLTGASSSGNALSHLFGKPYLGESRGTINANVNGRKVTMTIHWSPGGEDFVYDGIVDDRGFVQGTLQDKQRNPNNDPNRRVNWHSETALKCVATAPQQPEGPVITVPAVKLGPEVTYDESQSLIGILTVNVRDKVGEDSDCTYRATDPAGNLNDSFEQFHLKAHDTTSFQFTGAFRTGTTWDVVVDCGETKVTRLQKTY